MMELSEGVRKIAQQIADEMDPNAPHLPMAGLSKMLENLCPCGKDSDIGAHGFRDGELYDEYWCLECWNKKKS